MADNNRKWPMTEYQEYWKISLKSLAFYLRCGGIDGTLVTFEETLELFTFLVTRNQTVPVNDVCTMVESRSFAHPENGR